MIWYNTWIQLLYFDLMLITCSMFIRFSSIHKILKLFYSVFVFKIWFRFFSFLIVALSNNQSPYLRIMAVHALIYIKSNTRFLSIIGHDRMLACLPDILTKLFECLFEFEEPLFDAGLRALYNLLCIDPDGFTLNITKQVLPNLIELFKISYGCKNWLNEFNIIYVFNFTMSYYFK